MANQTIHIGAPLLAPLTMDVFPLLGGAVIAPGLVLAPIDIHNPSHFKVTRVGADVGWFIARLFEGGQESFTSPWYGKLLNADGDYWFSLQPPKYWEINGKVDTLADAGDEMALTPAYDLYHADIQFTRDQANTKDEYTVTWMKNGVQVIVFDTEPSLQVVKRVDGTDLIAETAMIEIGSTGNYKLDEPDDRVTLGELVVVITVAEIEGELRRFTRLIGRDS